MATFCVNPVVADEGAQQGSFIDEQWIPEPLDTLGEHSARIAESDAPLTLHPYLRAENTAYGGTGWKLCKSEGDSQCKDAKRFKFAAHFPACDSFSDEDCIRSLKITHSDDSSAEAKFLRYVYQSHPNAFLSDGSRVFKQIESPSIWSITRPDGSNDLYLVNSGRTGYFGNGQTIDSVFGAVFRIEIVDTNFSQPDEIQYSPYPSCDDTGCGASHKFAGARCVLYTQDGKCLRPLSMNVEDRIQLWIKTSKSPSGWFHGRMQDPNIELFKYESQINLAIEARPVKVPTFFYGPKSYNEMPSALKNYTTKCLKLGTCIWGGSENADKSPGSKRFLDMFYYPNSPEAVEALEVFAKYVDDQSVAEPALWNFSSLDFQTRYDTTGCFRSTSGLLGIVTTNSIAYLDGPPRYQRGFLNYTVAGLHKNRNGEVFNGTYDLVMRSDVARCVYGFSKAPISATISIAGSGDKTIATTVVGEKNGWLKLAAYGFSFSAKNIKIKLTQKKTTVTCVTSNNPKLIRKVTGYSPSCPAGYVKK